jgi:large subunit ribosomal protein L10
MSKRVKEMLIGEVGARIRGVRDMVVVNASKLDGVTSNKLRLTMKKKKISALTVRNKLAKKALADAGLSALDPFLHGPSTLIWGSEDIVALSKEIAKWAKEIEALVIKGGTTEGTSLPAAKVDELSKSPGRVELIGQIAAAMLSPGAQLGAALLGPGRKLASQVKQIADKEDTAEKEETAGG